jgi:hypothetical protein
MLLFTLYGGEPRLSRNSQSRRVQILEAQSMFQSGKGKYETLVSGDCLPE